MELNELFDAMSLQPIAYNPIYAKITGSLTAGVLLSQVVYWSRCMKNKEFYKTDEDFREELCLGTYELKNAKKTLQEKGLVHIKRKGVPAKTYYLLDKEELIRQITSYVETTQLDMWKPHNKTSGNHTTITETNTKTNTETNTRRESKLSRSLEKKEKSFSEQDKQIAEYYMQKKAETVPSASYLISKEKKEKTIENGAEAIAKLRKELSEEQIYAILKFTIEDDFWKTNVLTPCKLLKKSKEGVPYYLRFISEMKHKKEERPFIATIDC